MSILSATQEGTARFAARFPDHAANGFFRKAQGLTVSSIGIGSYLGAMDEATDAAYSEAVTAAAAGGINVIDTSLNYRHQRSERAIGRALNAIARDEVVLCTKAGYLVPDALPLGSLRAADIVGNMHSMAPAFLEDQLQRSLDNLGVDAIDVFYLHNPETQLQFIDNETFYSRIRVSFEALERIASTGLIRFFGTATWNGYRRNGLPDGLSLARLESIAREVGGKQHHFRFVQLPFNLAMTEGYGQRAEQVGERRMSILQAAKEFGITVVASASLLQTRLTSGLPGTLAESLSGPDSDATRAIQFARSAPGVTTALVGMSKVEHVKQNLHVAGYAPLPAEQFDRLFG
ncbi:MAG: aldo/keto reductase [Bryobacteraceae bacterium]|nr:aldo/keto reductase [Bryobacteraceae bacterium]